MNTYNRNVSDVEFLQAPEPTVNEWVTTCQALGIALVLDVPLLECIIAVGKITPSARIRRCLQEAYGQGGKNMAARLQSCRTTVDDALLDALRKSEEHDSLASQLLLYADSKGVARHQVAQQVGRSPEVQEFAELMAQSLLDPDMSQLRACRIACKQAHGPFQMILEEVIDKIEAGCMLGEAFTYHSETFDPLYIAMVSRAGRYHDNKLIGIAFDLLAKC